MKNRSKKIVIIISLMMIANIVVSQNMETPKLIKANGKNIDLKPAYADPILKDWNQDGKMDLIVGSYNGDFGVYKNIGTNKSPVYSSPVYLQTPEGKIKIPNW